MENNFEVLADRVCNADCKAVPTGVRQRAAQEKFSDWKWRLTKVKTKTYLLQSLENNQIPENEQGLKAVNKEIHLEKKQAQELRDNIEDKGFALEKSLQPTDNADYFALKNQVNQKIAEVREKSAELGVEVQCGGEDDWDWHSQNLLNKYELKAEKQRVQQLEEALAQNKTTREQEAKLAALQEEVKRRNNLAACPTIKTEWSRYNIAIMRELTGIDELTVTEHKFHFTFPNSGSAIHSSEKLQLTAFFDITLQGGICLAGATCNITELDLSDITKYAIAKNDLPYLIRKVKARWHSYGGLYHEISSLRDKYPVDWLMSERQLRLLCKSTAKIMCVLEVGHSYPSEGSMSFIQVEGFHNDINPHLAQKLQSHKLTDWVDYCYSCFAQDSHS